MGLRTISIWAFTVLAVLWGNGALAQSSYLLKPGDVIQVEVIEDASLNRSVLVPPDGRITLPLAGTVRAGGRTVEQVAASLTEALADDFATRPNVFVSIGRVATPDPAMPGGPAAPLEAPGLAVYVLGEAANPGLVEVAPGTNLLQLFSIVGGFTDFAATKRLQLRRIENGVERIYPLNYRAMLQGRSRNGIATVLEGDVIVIPQRRLFE